VIWLGSFLGKTEPLSDFQCIIYRYFHHADILVVRPKNVFVFCTSIFSFLVVISTTVVLPDTPFFRRYYFAGVTILKTIHLKLVVEYQWRLYWFTAKYYGWLLSTRWYRCSQTTECTSCCVVDVGFTSVRTLITLMISWHLADRAAPNVQNWTNVDYSREPTFWWIFCSIYCLWFYKPVDTESNWNGISRSFITLKGNTLIQTGR
jgi:hypothetical protein